MSGPAEAVEFDCIDCGQHVVTFGYIVQRERCASCEWITANVAPEHPGRCAEASFKVEGVGVTNGSMMHWTREWTRCSAEGPVGRCLTPQPHG